MTDDMLRAKLIEIFWRPTYETCPRCGEPTAVCEFVEECEGSGAGPGPSQPTAAAGLGERVPAAPAPETRSDSPEALGGGRDFLSARCTTRSAVPRETIRR